MTPPPAARNYDGWVAQLRRARRRQQAKQLLSAAGPEALPAIRRGLGHPDATVRRLCVNLLDRLVDEASVPDLVGALDDTDIEVRCGALHALACDTCKVNACRPGEDLFVPRSIELLSHLDPDLRAAAIDALGKVAGHRTPPPPPPPPPSPPRPATTLTAACGAWPRAGSAGSASRTDLAETRAGSPSPDRRVRVRRSRAGPSMRCPNTQREI
jgi:HEAT repeat protein